MVTRATFSSGIGITLGDPAGIGPEVVARALASREAPGWGEVRVIGDARIYERYRRRWPARCPLRFEDLRSPGLDRLRPGRPSAQSAAASLGYLNAAIELLRAGTISALVTGPVSKEGIAGLGYHFCGHTEYLAKAFQRRNFEMVFVSRRLRTLIVTRHIPLAQVSRALTKNKILRAIRLAHTALVNDFKISRPRLAVCGLNPHAGEGGRIGRDEQTKIIPAVAAAREEGIDVAGPFAADTLFVPSRVRSFDLIIAMYHDQGLIPVKTLDFADLVNLTIGLPFVRTSPAHGTAFDIAGTDQAVPGSMTAAIRLAAQLTRRRR